jgi:hypothetical protein
MTRKDLVMAIVDGKATQENEIGVNGESQQFEGVRGTSHSEHHGGVVGINDNQSDINANRTGVFGLSVKGEGVRGASSSPSFAGVVGTNDTSGQGVFGFSAFGPGVVGQCEHEAGVRGTSTNGTGVVGIGGTFAAQFVGTVEVTGNLTIDKDHDLFLIGADYAEALSTTDEDVEAGCVVVLGSDGDIHLCDRDYDPTVAGIVSGAGGVKPAIVLDRHDGSANVALIGKVWCQADADAAPIRPGDLLTTSATPGHCRRVTEPARAFGAVIGKALTPLVSGQGLVRVLVSPR